MLKYAQGFYLFGTAKKAFFFNIFLNLSITSDFIQPYSIQAWI